MLKEWDDFWESFLDERKLNSRISDLNDIDGDEKSQYICRNIYERYDKYLERLEDVRLKFVREIEHLPGVHLQTSRVKSVESLLEKIIKKRYENLLNKDNLYATITSENFSDIVTDLVGVRTIISYRGEWRKLHDEIVKKFPYEDEKEYTDGRFVGHKEGKQFIAEIPKAYYAEGDDLSMYEGVKIRTLIKPSGYRSVHYVISFLDTYIELQTRTIYDEAWSDCDHRYVYKHEENKSHAALYKLSDILCENTNASNDLGDLMHMIFETEDIAEVGDGTFKASDREIFERLESIVSRYRQSLSNLEEFKGCLKDRKDGPNDEQ